MRGHIGILGDLLTVCSRDQLLKSQAAFVDILHYFLEKLLRVLQCFVQSGDFTLAGVDIGDLCPLVGCAGRRVIWPALK